MTAIRRVLLVTHTGRLEARESAGYAADRLSRAGVVVEALPVESDEAGLAGFTTPHVEAVADWTGPDEEVDADALAEARPDMVLVLGGDGTLLRGAELARAAGVPLLGVNLGHVGFLAEAEPAALDDTLEHLLAGRYRVEERMTIDVRVTHGGELVDVGWALNEAAVNKTDTAKLLHCVLEVDGRPLSRFGCDGVVAATPTGSTAYAFSAGGPVVWPEVEAMLVVPLSAHALFSRPLVVAPDSQVAIEVAPGADETAAVLWCDGRRMVSLAPGSRVQVGRGSRPVRLARLHERPFTDRLVAKFGLPVEGWRGSMREQVPDQPDEG